MKKNLRLVLSLNDKGKLEFQDENMTRKISGEELSELIKKQHLMKKGDVVLLSISSINTRYTQTAFSLQTLAGIVSKSIDGGVMTTRGDEVQIFKTDLHGVGPVLGIISRNEMDIPMLWDETGRSTNQEDKDDMSLILFVAADKKNL